MYKLSENRRRFGTPYLEEHGYSNEALLLGTRQLPGLENIYTTKKNATLWRFLLLLTVRFRVEGIL
jgi:hypothetical protein